MKILYIDHYAGNEQMGMEFRPFYIAKELQKLGHEVLIVAADFSHLRKWNPPVKEDFQKMSFEGVDYLFIKTNRYQGNGIERFKTMLQFVHKIRANTKKILDTFVPDAIICSSTYPLDTYAGQKLAKKSGARLYHEIHDLWPLSPRILGGMSKWNPFIVLMQRAEISAYKNSKKIISILPNTEVYVRKMGIQTPVVVIENGLPDEYINEKQPANQTVLELVTELKEQSRYVISYAGGISISNAMMDLLKAMELIKDLPVSAVIIGDGIEKENLIQYAQAKQLPVHFIDSIHKSEVISSLALMDALFIGDTTNEIYQYGVSMNKIFDYMMSGVPVVNALGIKHCSFNKSKTSIDALPGDYQSIADAIKKTMNLSQKERNLIRNRSQEYVREHHKYSTIGKKFSQTIQD